MKKNQASKVACTASNPRPAASNKVDGALDVDYTLLIDGLCQIAIQGTAQLVPIKTPGQKKYNAWVDAKTMQVLQGMKLDDRLTTHQTIESACVAAVEFI